MTQAEGPRDLDPVLHSASRIAIVGRLSYHNEVRFAQLQKLVRMTSGNLASHLERLERAGYVRQRDALVALRPGRLVGLTPKGRDAFAAYADGLEDLLADVQRSVRGAKAVAAGPSDVQ